MTDLIYLSLPWLSAYDNFLESKNYQHYKWFRLNQAEHWPLHTTSRVHNLDTPWKLAPTVCPIPVINNNEMNFGKVIEQIAENFCKKVAETNKQPYLCWSGGIDSTSILVSLLKTASKDFLASLVILCSERSIIENAYFYHTYIDKKLKVVDIDTFKVDSTNFDKIIIVDGEAGNQIMGQTAVHKLIYAGQTALLFQPWQKIRDLSILLMGATTFNIQLIKESIAHAPIPITTGYDFLWWTNFNFKFDDVLLRKALSYTDSLTPEQIKTFWNDGLFRFYAQPEMQIWSMLTKDVRCHSSKHMPKYIPKKYIFDFDQNDFYFANKSEEASGSSVFFNNDVGSKTTTIFAIDKDWNKYSIAERDTRIQLGKILKRI